MKWWELLFLSARKILAPGEEENLELEEEEDAAAGGAGLVEAFPPRTPGTVLTLSTVNATVWDASSVVACFYSIPSPRDCLTVFFLFSLSVLCMASSLNPTYLFPSFARYAFISE